MSKKREQAASLRGSPTVRPKTPGACSETQIAPFATSEADPTYSQWRAMGPKRAAKLMSMKLKLDADRSRKLELVLRYLWKQPPKSANESSSATAGEKEPK